MNHKYYETSMLKQSAQAYGAVYTIRAANEMGGLSVASNEGTYVATGIPGVINTPEVIEVQYYTIDGRRLQNPIKGITIVRTLYKDGSSTVTKFSANTMW